MKYSYLIFSFLTIVSPIIVASDELKNSTTQENRLSLKYIKDSRWSLTEESLGELARLFQADIFVESGTYKGDTTERALNHFKKIHTVELDYDLYEAAKNRFEDNEKIVVHHGNSPEIFSTILNQLNGNILFWLDGHYSGRGTACGESATPIMQELEAIKNSNVNDATILIDDIRCFLSSIKTSRKIRSLTGYPTAYEVEQKILEINPNYRFLIFGDTALAFLSTKSIQPSELLEACTISRLADDEQTDASKVANAELIIAQAANEEKEAIITLYKTFKGQEEFGLGRYYSFWYGLTCLKSGNSIKARKLFLKARQLGLPEERVTPYLEQIQ